MYVHVSLLNGFDKSLTYKIPATTPRDNLIGTIVQVPLRNQIVPAVVTEQFGNFAQKPRYAIKEFIKCEPFPDDNQYHDFLEALSTQYCVSKIHFIKRIRQFLNQKSKSEIPAKAVANRSAQHTPVTLTDEQQNAYKFIARYITDPRYAPTVLHGITGSGKTEVYKKLITTAIAEQKTVILLLPEVTLALQFYKILREQLPEAITIMSFHSGNTVSETKQLWQILITKKPVLIIGVHLPILLPVSNLGLIIIDEEHESGYQEKRHPKVDSKQAAILRAQTAQIPIVFGSATPSLSTLYNVKTKNWRFFQLKKRFGGQLPQLTTILLPQDLKRPHFWISRELHTHITDRLSKKEQIIIFLNRRGFSFFVQCKKCTFIFKCTNCSVSLTLHGDNTLSCHYCSTRQNLPAKCPECAVPEKNFLKKGIGTQQVVTIIEKLFPRAVVARADLDVTARKKSWKETITNFTNGSIDILVGTQTITKGFHFPNVTLVGILWADLNLHFPVFNATENTLSQLIQVAGRAGRARDKSDVIVQVMQDHPIYKYMNEVDYLSFYKEEIDARKMLHYPPCGVLVELEIKHTDENMVEQESNMLAQELLNIADKDNYSVTVLGPAKPPVYKIKRWHTRTIFLKTLQYEHVTQLYSSIDKERYNSSLFFTPIF